MPSGPPGAQAAGVPRIDAKKLLKKVSELCAGPDQLAELLASEVMPSHARTHARYRLPVFPSSSSSEEEPALLALLFPRKEK